MEELRRKYHLSQFGFCPDEPPMRRLSHADHQQIEEALLECGKKTKTKKKNDEDEDEDGVGMREMLSTIRIIDWTLMSHQELQRAYLVYCMLVHFYLFKPDSEPSSTAPINHLPASLAVPFYGIAEKLGLPKVLCYSSFQLFNFKYVSEEKRLRLLSDLQAFDHAVESGIDLNEDIAFDLYDIDTLSSFTGTESERHFNLVPTAIELACGSRAICLAFRMRDAIARSESIASLLRQFSKVIAHANQLLSRIYEKCDPAVFYQQLRPYLAGFEDLCLDGVIVDGKEVRITYAGGSAAQSPLVQFFDSVLNVKHPSEKSRNFLLEMRRYMDPRHKQLLDDADEFLFKGLYEYASSDPASRSSYNAAVSNLEQFRNTHKAIAFHYIIRQLQKPSTTSISESSPSSSSSSSPLSLSSNLEAVGTGGTNIRVFLNTVRDETHRMLFQE